MEGETHTHKGWYLKYRNNDWKGERAGRHDEAKDCRYTVSTETKWKGSKARNIGDGCKLFYNVADGIRNGIKIVIREKLVESVLRVKRVSDRLKCIAPPSLSGESGG